MSETCRHGSLPRSCLICELDDEIDWLRAELARAKGRIKKLERELNPDPEAHLAGWDGDDE